MNTDLPSPLALCLAIDICIHENNIEVFLCFVLIILFT